jgi:hypothetical protein
VKKLVVAVLLGTAGAVALAAPKAESAMECSIAADMAIVARSLAQEAVQRPQAGAIMARIYDVSESVRGKELMRDILDAAYRDNGRDHGGDNAGAGSSQKFAEELFVTCMKTGGNMDTVLGKRL